jgi:GTP-binding protein
VGRDRQAVSRRLCRHRFGGLSEDPVGDFYQINSELALYDPALGEKPQLVALNKCDLPDVEARAESIRSALAEKGYEVAVISAVAGTNVRRLLYRASEVLKETPEPEPVDDVPVYRYETDPNAFTIEQLTDDTFQVNGVAIERAAAMTYWEHDQSVRRFQRILETIGIDAALREAGVQPGHTVLVGDHELEWAD